VLLFAFSVPIFGLLLAFITMTSGMTVERQRNEIAVLRSRGAMVAQMVGIATVESLLLGAVAMAASLPISAGIAWAISRTRSFLDFSSTIWLELIWPTTIYFGLGAIACWHAGPADADLPRGARQHCHVQTRAGAQHARALWQRMWLDVIADDPGRYGIYLLRQQGSIDVLGAPPRATPSPTRC
jgi:putative ABC transport system permease protein